VTANSYILLHKPVGFPFYFVTGSLPEDVITLLEKELSYPVKSADYIQVAIAEKHAKENMEREKKGLPALEFIPYDGRVHFLKTSKNRKLFFPIGLKNRVENFLSFYDIGVTEKKEYAENETSEAFVWGGPKLRDYQISAALTAISSGSGVVCLPTGAGKSLIAMKVIYALKCKTLIVVHTKVLFEQWCKNIDENFNLVGEMFGESIKKYPGITVSMVQTLHLGIKGKSQHGAVIAEDNFDVLVVDECFSYNSLVFTDGGLLKIGDIVENNLDVLVLTHTGEFRKILSYFKKSSSCKMVRIIHEFGEIECTENHRILSNGGWKEAKELSSGDVIYSLYARTSKKIPLQDMQKGIRYSGGVGGTYESRACSSGATGKLVSETLEGNEQGRTCGKCEEKQRDRECLEISSNSDEGARADDSGELTGRYEHNVSQQKESFPQIVCSPLFGASRVCRLEIFDAAKSNEESPKDIGKCGVGENTLFVSNDVDASIRRDIQSPLPTEKKRDNEGISLENRDPACDSDVVYGRRMYNTEQQCDVSENIRAQCPNITWEQEEGRVPSYTKLDAPTMGGSISSEPCKEGVGIETTQDRRGRYFFRSDSSRSDSGLHEIQGGERLSISSKHDFVYDIEVDVDHSYVVYGVPVHNCHHVPSDTFYEVSKKIDARHKYGFSATPERTDGAEMKMEAALGPIIATMAAEDLIEANHLVRPVFEFIEVDPGYATGKTFAQVYKNGVVSNNARNLSIARRAQELAAEGRQVYIHVEQVLHGQLLSNIMKAPFVYSKSKDRVETIETFKKGYTRILISTLLGEGADIPSISAIIMAGGRKTESGTIQKVGRALRPDRKFNTAIVVDFADRGRYLAEHAVARYNSYIKFYGEKIVRSGRK